MFFHKKLDVINLEFDGKIAALVAQLLFKQSVVEEKKKELLQKLSISNNNEEIRQLKHELSNTEGLFKVDDTMAFTIDERKLISDPKYQPSELELRRRITRISRKAMQFLRKLKVPNEQIFSDPKFHKAMKIKAIPEPKLSLQKRRNLKPVIVAGIAFYLDHDNQIAVPMSPLDQTPNRSPTKEIN